MLLRKANNCYKFVVTIFGQRNKKGGGRHTFGQWWREHLTFTYFWRGNRKKMESGLGLVYGKVGKEMKIGETDMAAYKERRKSKLAFYLKSS